MKEREKYLEKRYFDELLERIKVIRTSERMAYQKIKEVFKIIKKGVITFE